MDRAQVPEQTAADEKLNAADTAVTGNYKAVYGTDTNALTMIGAKTRRRRHQGCYCDHEGGGLRQLRGH